MPLVVISHPFRFIYVRIAKNASSTLRTELVGRRYGGEDGAYESLAEDVRRSYFTFAFVRHPVARFLSAYQEVSLRLEGAGTPTLPPPAFASMKPGLTRLEAFLAEAERHLWDRHLWRQTEFLAGVRLDATGRVESLHRDLNLVLQRLGLDPVAALARQRSRDERAQRYGYDRHWIRAEELPRALADRIATLYSEDLELWRRAPTMAVDPAAGDGTTRAPARWPPPVVTRNRRGETS